MAIKAMRLEKGMAVLEVGIGTGVTIEHYPEDINIVGIDLSSEMLSVAQKKITKLGLKNIELKKMSAEKLEFPDQSFDRVYAPSVISVVSDPKKVIDEMARVCRPGGFVCIVSHFEGEDRISRALDKGCDPIVQKYLGFRMSTPRSVYLQHPLLEVVTIEKTLPPNFSDVILLRRRG